MVSTLAREFSLQPQFVSGAVRLLDEGATVPFIARYRKEHTGSMDDQVLRALADRLSALRALDKRREEVGQQLRALEALTPELERQLEGAASLTELEDLYRPYRPKRRTRGSIAREKGLEPLAARLLMQRPGDDPEALARDFVGPERGVEGVPEALNGAMDILAEDFADDAATRKALREQAGRTAKLSCAAKEQADSVYRMYYQFEQPVFRLAGHQVLAINRGEREGFLRVKLLPDEEAAVRALKQRFVKGVPSASGRLVEQAARDGYDRLLKPAIEREVRQELTERASEGALRVFSMNLRQLLMQPPVRGQVTLSLDPAFRTGCKLAVVDEIGRVLEVGVVYPTPPQRRVEEAKRTLRELMARYRVGVIAIGNGTASRETEQFVAGMLKEMGGGAQYTVVSEAGASVYSASKLAAEEFPEYDVSLRSAVSIARRLQDPLAELVKIDPKAIGVGQYQHDLKEARLDEALGGVVEDCVNHVGVDLNTASQSLLTHVAGIGPQLAKNIVAFREENGAFASRSQLKKVPKLGPKAFEQCAGFLRVPGSAQGLDNTGVHPESYEAARRLMEACGYPPEQAGRGELGDLKARVEGLGWAEAARRAGVGEPTLRDIVFELMKPGRDPRDELPPPLLRSDVMELSDLTPGMELMGTVRNVIDFGAFVDIGVHQDGLVHVSRLADRFVKHPSEVVKVGDVVKVWVLEVDPVKKRISLTLRERDVLG